MINREFIEKYISVNPQVQHGKPCIKGTRTPVYAVLEALASEMNFERVKKEFAPLNSEDIHACILYAALLTDEAELVDQPAL